MIRTMELEAKIQARFVEESKKQEFVDLFEDPEEEIDLVDLMASQPRTVRRLM